MVKSILLVGVGGQGTILTTKILSAGLVELGYDVKMSEIHGMAQRGGSVTTQIRYGDKVYSPNIALGEADVIVAFEKIEALRWLPYLKEGGILVTDTREIPPLPVLIGAMPYPSESTDTLKACLPGVRVLEAAKIAEQLGNIRSQNIVLLGALIKLLGVEGTDWNSLVARFVPEKTKEANLKAFAAGQKAAAV
jgi:indolepyruvate ferredoxin oxidoreductase beta subunit